MLTNKQKTIKTASALGLFIIAILLKSTLKINNEILWLINFSCIYLIAGYDVLWRAIRNISRGKVFDEHFLMTVASLGAIILGEFVEGVTVMIFFQIGDLFESYAVGKSRKSISNLMDIRPDTAKVIREGKEEEVFPEEVKIGETIVVYAGDKIPLDGEVVEGSCHLNVSALTGESKPSSVTVGDKILSGTICQDGKLLIRAEKEFYDSTVSKILDMVENASGKKAKVEKFISVFSKYYTPTVVFSALALAIIPSLFTNEWSVWINRALTFLVVSCPCALVISVPLGFFGGIGGAGNRGVLIKGSDFVERLSKANRFVFDKTGTLTKGEFLVTGVFPKDKKDEILSFAYACEKNSNHPIARAIINTRAKFKTNFQIALKDEEYSITEMAGKGIIARRENEEILCGNKTLLIENGVVIPLLNELLSSEENSFIKSQTVVYMSINGTFLGVITLGDTIKDEAKELVDELKKERCEVVMLTGDNEESAREVASSLGIKEYYGQLLPQDKMKILEDIIGKKSKNDIVCFVGDGINDAPVLMRADVGISMGGIGSDSAIEASDVVLMCDNLKAIIEAKNICKKTMNIVRQNIVFALAVKFLALVLATVGIGGMWFAVFADVGVSILAILNSMRTILFGVK